MAKSKDTKAESAKPQGDMPPATGQSQASPKADAETGPKAESSAKSKDTKAESDGPVRSKRWQVSLKHNQTRTLEFSGPVTSGEAIQTYNAQMGIIGTPYQHVADPLD